MLSETVDLALNAVKRDPENQLRLGWRQTVWAQFGERAIADNRLSVAHRQRIELAVAGVRHVLPLWTAKYPENEIPLTALTTIEAIVKGEETDASDIFDQLWQEVVHLSVEQPYPEVAVGFAAVQALSTAMSDEFFDSSDLDPDRDDGDDPESQDSAYYASVAAAHGPPSDPGSSPERRLEFWTWWLTDAVEMAAKSQ